MCLITALAVILQARIEASSIMHHVILEVVSLDFMEILPLTNVNPVIPIALFVLALPKIIVLSAEVCLC